MDPLNASKIFLSAFNYLQRTPVFSAERNIFLSGFLEMCVKLFC